MTPPVKKCKECKTVIADTVARDSFAKYGEMFCTECQDKIESDKPLPSEQVVDQSYNVEGQPDTCEVLGARDTIMKTIEGVESAPSAPREEESTFENAVSLNAPESIITTIRGYVGNDVLQVFGPTGSGKSKFALECARQALAEGKKVFYLDTERNLTDDDIKSLKGCDYKYTPVLEEIDKICQTLPKCDLVIIDSIGFPILTAYARYSLKQKGDALLKLIAIFGDLKQWAYKNNGLAIVTNQPESDFNKAPDHIIRPFGDKSQFACKEIWRTDIIKLGEVTKSKIAAFRSRSMGHKTVIATMEISDTGVSITKVVR